MAVLQKGQIFGTGGRNLILTTDMFGDPDNNWSMPYEWRVKENIQFYNSTRINNTTVLLNNPAVDDVFNVMIEFTINNIDWFELELEGTVYHSLGGYNISTALIGGAINDPIRTISGLCLSNNVNRYAEFCPDTNAPHSEGDFRWYAHNTRYGVVVSGASAFGGTITWRGSKILTGFINRLFKSPYSFSN